VVEHLPSSCEALDLISSTKENKTKHNRKQTNGNTTILEKRLLLAGGSEVKG
jgi:hypothetical protein